MWDTPIRIDGMGVLAPRSLVHGDDCWFVEGFVLSTGGFARRCGWLYNMMARLWSWRFGVVAIAIMMTMMIRES